jgi:hypothetical protein
MDVSGQLHAPAVLPTHRERASGTHWIKDRGGGGSTAGLDLVPRRKEFTGFYVYQNYCEICHFGSVRFVPQTETQAATYLGLTFTVLATFGAVGVGGVSSGAHGHPDDTDKLIKWRVAAANLAASMNHYNYHFFSDSSIKNYTIAHYRHRSPSPYKSQISLHHSTSSQMCSQSSKINTAPVKPQSSSIRTETRR